MPTPMLALTLLASITVFAEPAPFIIGGREEAPGSPIAKSTVLLEGKIQRATFTCTGSIVGDDLILTAGHCLGGGGYATITVFFRTNKDGKGPAIRVVKQTRMRDDIPQDEFDWDDLALLKLETKIPAGYEPAKFLDDVSLLQPGLEITLAGYGQTVPTPPSSGNGGSGILRSVEQKILQAPYGQKEILVDIREKGACRGDSGGPAFLVKDGAYFLFGAASRMTERDRLPDQGREKRYGCLVDMVYSNALLQKDWIERAKTELAQ